MFVVAEQKIASPFSEAEAARGPPDSSNPVWLDWRNAQSAETVEREYGEMLGWLRGQDALVKTFEETGTVAQHSNVFVGGGYVDVLHRDGERDGAAGESGDAGAASGMSAASGVSAAPGLSSSSAGGDIDKSREQGEQTSGTAGGEAGAAAPMKEDTAPAYDFSHHYPDNPALKMRMPEWFLKLRFLDGVVSSIFKGFDKALATRDRIEKLYQARIKESEKPLGEAIALGKQEGLVPASQILIQNFQDGDGERDEGKAARDGEQEGLVGYTEDPPRQAGADGWGKSPGCPSHAVRLRTRRTGYFDDSPRLKGLDNGFWICVHKRFEVPEQQLKLSGFTEDCRKLPLLTGTGFFVDVGSNVGYCALLMASFGFPVVAFEPLRESYELLVASVLLNPKLHGRVLVFNCALGSRPGLGELVDLDVGPVGNRGNTLVASGGGVQTSGQTSDGLVPVPGQTSDGLVPGRSDDRRVFRFRDLRFEIDPFSGAVGFNLLVAGNESGVEREVPLIEARGAPGRRDQSLVPVLALSDILQYALHDGRREKEPAAAPASPPPASTPPTEQQRPSHKTGSQLLRENIGILKIDTEGSEYHVLTGLGADFVCAGRAPRIKFEVSPPMLARRGSSVGQLFSWLDRHGYILFEEDTEQLVPRDEFPIYSLGAHRSQRDILALFEPKDHGCVCEEGVRQRWPGVVVRRRVDEGGGGGAGASHRIHSGEGKSVGGEDEQQVRGDAAQTAQTGDSSGRGKRIGAMFVSKPAELSSENDEFVVGGENFAEVDLDEDVASPVEEELRSVSFQLLINEFAERPQPSLVPGRPRVIEPEEPGSSNPEKKTNVTLPLPSHNSRALLFSRDERGNIAVLGAPKNENVANKSKTDELMEHSLFRDVSQQARDTTSVS